MKILDMLYDGKIFPSENVNPVTKKYKQIDQDRMWALDELRETLSDVENCS